jgi:hypothetical protein
MVLTTFSLEVYYYNNRKNILCLTPFCDRSVSQSTEKLYHNLNMSQG